jgi:hypothetical protein
MRSDKPETFDDYVWSRLSAWKYAVGRDAVSKIARSAVHCPMTGMDGAEGMADGYLIEQANKSGFIGPMILSWVLQIVVAEIVKIVAEWLAKRDSPVNLPRIHG